MSHQTTDHIYKLHTLINIIMFFFCHLSGSGSWGQQLEQGDPDAPHPSRFHLPFRGDTKSVSSQPRDIFTPACPWSALESPLGLTCPKHLPSETSRRHPDQMSKPPQLAPLNRRNSSSTLSLSQMSSPYL